MKVLPGVTPCDSLRCIPLLISDKLNKKAVVFIKMSLTKFQVMWPHIPQKSQFFNHRVQNPVLYCNMFGMLKHVELISMFLKLVNIYFVSRALY